MKARRIRFAKLEETFFKNALAICAIFSTLITAGIIFVLMGETLAFFQQVSLQEFFGSTLWRPLFEPRSFGVWPLISGTLMVAVGAGIVGIPTGLGIAIFLSEYCPDRLRGFIKPVLEVLAGVPTVVYGYFALSTITPLLRKIIPDIGVFNAASAAIVVGIMILPMVASLCDDALRAVPRSLREGGYALGTTKFEVSTQVVVPSALSGVVASFILAISRAIGETMAVTLAAGATPQVDWNYFDAIQTMTAYIVQVSLGDTPHGTIAYSSIFAVGMVLFVITLSFNLIAQYVVKKFRRVYE